MGLEGNIAGCMRSYFIFVPTLFCCTFLSIIIKVSFKSAYSVLQHQQLSEEYMEFSADILETVNVSRKAGGHVFVAVLAGKKQETTGELPDQLVL